MSLSIRPQFFSKNLNDKERTLKEAINGGNDYVFWLVDYDVILKEEREGADTKQKLQRIDKKLLKQAARVGCQYETLYMLPCLEFWFLLHFENTTKSYLTCTEVEKTLRRYLPDYSKKPLWIKQHLLEKLSPYFQEAIERAVKLYHYPLTDTQARADIGQLFAKLASDLNLIY